MRRYRGVSKLSYPIRVTMMRIYEFRFYDRYLKLRQSSHNGCRLCAVFALEAQLSDAWQQVQQKILVSLEHGSYCKHVLEDKQGSFDCGFYIQQAFQSLNTTAPDTRTVIGVLVWGRF